MTENTTASGAADALRAAITRAFHLGQTYWQQADSESYAEQDKSDDTYKKYKALLEETCTTLAASAPVAPAVGNSGFDYKTAADLLNGKTVRDEAIRKFVAASRWAHDDSAGLSATLISARGELASREAEIALLKKTLMDAEPAPQPAPMPYPTDAQIDAVYEQTMGQHLRSQDAPAVRRFGRAMFFYAWNSATQAAPAPQPTVPEGYVLVPVEPTQEMEAAAYRNSSTYGGGPGADYRAMIAAAPAAPAINKVSDIIDAYGMTPGEPERVADIPGLAEALEAAFADGSAQVTGAAPLQQGEYPATGNPEADRVLGRLNSSDPEFDDCAEAAALIYKLVAEIKGPEGFSTWKDAAVYERGLRATLETTINTASPLAYLYTDGKHPGLDFEHAPAEDIRPGFVCIPLVAAHRAARGAAQAAPAPVAEDAEIRKALHDAATSLETINRIADQYMQGMMDVRLYAASRAKVAREALAAQPEGGAA